MNTTGSKEWRAQMNEKIECAAIRHDGMTYMLDPPARHNDIIAFLDRNGLQSVARGMQGFLTTESRFVDRKEALRIATKAGQLRNAPHPSGDLFSEDLW